MDRLEETVVVSVVTVVLPVLADRTLVVNGTVLVVHKSMTLVEGL